MAKFYLVGGAVRDKLMGINNPKDLDYVVEAKSYEDMKEAIISRKGQIFLETPEYYTIRARIPGLSTGADYVLCRKESCYSDGRRPDKVEVGTLLDDLSRRDFTVNAMAVDEEGILKDPFGGAEDLKVKLLKCVGSARERFSEDSLRMLRAIRFKVTKGLYLHSEIAECLRDYNMVSLLNNVSGERIREELHRCFKHNTIHTLSLLMREFPLLMNCFPDGMWLMPTMKE